MNICEVQFVGAAGTVTGSKHLLTIGKPIEEPEVPMTAWEEQLDTKSKLIHSLQTKHLGRKKRDKVKKQLRQLRNNPQPKTTNPVSPRQKQQFSHDSRMKNINVVDEDLQWTTSEQLESPSSSSSEDEEEEQKEETTEEFHKAKKQETAQPVDFAASLNVLIDCGMYQGDKDWKQQNWQPIPSHFKVESNTDAIIVTHGHIDHVGYLPRMVQQGFTGVIYCSPRSFQLMQIVLPDAAQLQEEDAEYANAKEDVTSHKPALPFFTMEHVEMVFSLVKVVPYHEKTVISKNGIEVAFQYFDAGHLLGSCYVQLWLDATVPAEQSTTMLFSGDIGTFKRSIPLQTVPEHAPIDVDYIISESTYGNVSHLKGNDAKNLDDLVKPVFKEAVNFIMQTKGVILIPAFSIGRSQHVAFILLKMMEDGEIPTIPVHINSPMASKALQLYIDYMTQKGDQTVKVLSKVQVHDSLKDSKILQDTLLLVKEPRIVISSSGMLSGGRVMHHAKEIIPHKQNVLLLSGYQGVGTPGRLLQEGETKIKILGKVLHVHCKVMTAHGMSAHGDADDVMEWLKNIKAQGEKKRLKQCFIVHGEGLPSRALAERFTKELNVQSIIPAFGTKFFIERRRMI